MTVKDVLLLLRHRYQSPVARSKLKFLTFFDKKAYLDGEIFFGFSNSELVINRIKIDHAEIRDARTGGPTFLHGSLLCRLWKI